MCVRGQRGCFIVGFAVAFGKYALISEFSKLVGHFLYMSPRNPSKWSARRARRVSAGVQEVAKFPISPPHGSSKAKCNVVFHVTSTALVLRWVNEYRGANQPVLRCSIASDQRISNRGGFDAGALSLNHSEATDITSFDVVKFPPTRPLIG